MCLERYATLYVGGPVLVKIPENNFCCKFVQVARGWVFGNMVEDATLEQFFLINLTPFFQRVSID